MVNLAFDLILGMLLLASAWVTFHSTSLSRAVVYFVVFGLILALIWLRLHVWVVAMAEAGVGAILTGIMLQRGVAMVASNSTSTPSPRRNLALAVTVSGLVFLLLFSVVAIRPEQSTTSHELLLSIITERQLWFACIAATVIALSIFVFLRQAHLIKKLFALNLMAAGVFLFMISMAQHLREPSPASQALVLAGMLISLSATTLALHIFRRFYASSEQLSLPAERT